MRRQQIALVIPAPKVPPEPPRDRGQLVYDDEISERYYRGRVKTRWVREHFPKDQGIKIGRHWAWYEYDIPAIIAAVGQRSRSA